MKILVINAGSTSLKYKLFRFDDLTLVREGEFREDYQRAIKNNALQGFLKDNIGAMTNHQELKAIGHRVVHGGRDFREPVQIDERVLKTLSQYNSLAPLHNPYNLGGIRALISLFPQVMQVAVFDTAFFKDLPDKAKIYALPLKYYQEGVQRFGFHGISHQYVAEEASKNLNKPLEECNLITVHLGGGCSITAIKNGKAIDTSMGFTPLEGLVMGTRPGDIDAGILLYLLKEKNLSIEEIDNLLNHQAGIKGLSGHDDFRALLKLVADGDKKAQLAFDIFVYRIQKYIGAYFAILGRVDAIVFTGAIGSGQAITREAIIKNLDILRNVPSFAIETNEELAIARQIIKHYFSHH